MSERNQNDLPFDSEDSAEQALWAALRELPREAPSADLRRGFYAALDDASNESVMDRVRQWLGLSGNAGWATAIAFGVLGFALAGGFMPEAQDSDRMAALEQNVALLNRELILDRLEDANASKRLKGVFDARDAVGEDEQITRALLMLATDDRVQSVRTAAIDALGPSMSRAEIGDALMGLLAQAESPTVQLALVNLVLRNGTVEQLNQLLDMAEQGRLHPDLASHVRNSLGSATT